MSVFLTFHQDDLVTKLFNAVTGTNCCTHEDIALAGGFANEAEVGYALRLIRDPDVARDYGWTIPHVQRGRPRMGQAYRYQVVGLSGQVLTPSEIRLIREGALSTVRAIATETRNEANALRLSATVSPDPKFKKWARDNAIVLEGVSVQAEQQASMLAALLRIP